MEENNLMKNDRGGQMTVRALFGIVVIVGILIAAGMSSSFVGPSEFNTVVAASDTNTSVSFGFQANRIVIINDGTDEIFFTISSLTATLSNFELKASESITISPPSPTEGMAIICNAAETATVRIIAWQ